MTKVNILFFSIGLISNQDIPIIFLCPELNNPNYAGGELNEIKQNLRTAPCQPPKRWMERNSKASSVLQTSFLRNNSTMITKQIKKT